jgi:hypothetical protein
MAPGNTSDTCHANFAQRVTPGVRLTTTPSGIVCEFGKVCFNRSPPESLSQLIQLSFLQIAVISKQFLLNIITRHDCCDAAFGEGLNC